MKPLTLSMVYALRNAKADGSVVAGASCDRRGRLTRTAASTLRALAARGLVALSLSSDGGMAARLTDEGRNTLVLLDSGNGYLEAMGMGR